MLQIQKSQRHLKCLLLGIGLLVSCDSEIIFEPKFDVATCSDGIKNQDELDIDCGSEKCGPCFATYEPAPCHNELTMNRILLNQAGYKVSQVYTGNPTYQGAVTFTAEVQKDGAYAGSLSVQLEDYNSLKKSTVYTLNAKEANSAEPPFYHMAYVEFTPHNTVYPSKASQGEIYLEVLNDQLIFTFCDVVLNNPVNFSNTFITSGHFTAYPY